MSCQARVTEWSDPAAPLTEQLLRFCSLLAGPADLPVWLALLDDGAESVIYVGPGNGWRALALAEAGQRLIAIEASPTMAAAFTARLDACEAATRERVSLIVARIEDAAPLDGCKAVLVPSMLLNYAVTEPACHLAFLRACRAQLRAGGLLALELYNPYLLMSEGVTRLPPGPLHGGSRLWMGTTIHRARVDPWAQRCTSYRLLCDCFEPGGASTRYVIPTSAVVAVFPRELALLLDAAGFRLEGMHALRAGLEPPSLGDSSFIARARAR